MPYPMERDSRRGRGQWRGCYSFRNIINEDQSAVGSKRHGGLKMGHTYYYYVSVIPLPDSARDLEHLDPTQKADEDFAHVIQYEVDGSTEMHDPAMPSTTACPYLPGQTINAMVVPVEHALRGRSASLNSLHPSNFKTMDPKSKFITPRPAPAAPSETFSRNNPIARHAHLGSTPTLFREKLSSRSPSPSPSWRRFFARKSSSRSRQRASSRESDDRSVMSSASPEDSGRATPSDAPRARDMSPEDLRRFLMDDQPACPPSNQVDWSLLAIPHDIMEEVDDDDNFATSAVSETQSFATSLSPPPSKRPATSGTAALSLANSSALTLVPARSKSRHGERTVEVEIPSSTFLEERPAQQSKSCPSAASSVVGSPISSHSHDEELASFYDSNDDDDDDASSSHASEMPSSLLSSQARTSAFNGYSLPRHTEGSKLAVTQQPTIANCPSPQLLANSDAGMPASSTTFLDSSIVPGLDDFASELDWMVHNIGNKST